MLGFNRSYYSKLFMKGSLWLACVLTACSTSVGFGQLAETVVQGPTPAQVAPTPPAPAPIEAPIPNVSNAPVIVEPVESEPEVVIGEQINRSIVAVSYTHLTLPTTPYV